MSWSELFDIFIVCHLTGDFLLQTNWQASNKAGGLGRDREKQRALASHAISYTCAYAPALVWIGIERGAWWAFVAAALIALPHWIQDDGRLVVRFAKRVKKLGEPPDPVPVYLMVDQTFHVIALLAVAMLVAE
jgi:uncharacterized protein DUF3307